MRRSKAPYIILACLAILVLIGGLLVSSIATAIGDGTYEVIKIILPKEKVELEKKDSIAKIDSLNVVPL